MKWCTVCMYPRSELAAVESNTTDTKMEVKWWPQRKKVIGVTSAEELKHWWDSDALFDSGSSIFGGKNNFSQLHLSYSLLKWSNAKAILGKQSPS